MVGLPSTATGLVYYGASFSPITDVSVDGGSCIDLGYTVFGLTGVPLNSIRCSGDGGAGEHCVTFDTSPVNQIMLVGINCTGGYNGSGSSVFAETGGLTQGCGSQSSFGIPSPVFAPASCAFDVTWNGTDPLYNSGSEADLDIFRYTHPAGYAPVTLTGTAFAAPDPAKGFNQSFALTSSCSTPCTIPAPVYTMNGQSGYFAVTQPATGIASPVSWNAAYKNTAQPFNGNGKTTWFPWIANIDNATVTLGASFHN